MEQVKPDSEETTRGIQRLQSDPTVFDDLFTRHRNRLKVTVGLRLDAQARARFDESDVIQETYVEAYRRLRDYLQRQPMPFHLWLRKTALEQVIMLRRKHVGAAQRSVRREQRLPEDSAARLAREIAASGASPSDVLNERERAEAVRTALATLSPADQEILLMRHYEGLSYDEIAYLMDIESATARKRNGRALIRLHRLLRDFGITESQL